MDNVLPFGLRSTPKIFNAVADALEWLISKEGVECNYHYLDDFTILGLPGWNNVPRVSIPYKQSVESLGYH